LESPFQFQSLIKTIDQIREASYSMSMYQLFVDDVLKSTIRVKDRFKEGGLYINTDQIGVNFNANLSNVASQYDRFDHAYFIDNSANRKMKLAAEFKGPSLIRYHSISNLYLRDLFEQKAVIEKIDGHTLKIIQANKDYTSEVLRQSLPGRRLKF
jgi:predicted ABC-type ATPase